MRRAASAAALRGQNDKSTFNPVVSRYISRRSSAPESLTRARPVDDGNSKTTFRPQWRRARLTRRYIQSNISILLPSKWNPGGNMDTAALDSRLSRATTDFLSRDRKLLIDDQWVAAASGKTFPVYNPATGRVLALVAEAD